MSEPLDGFEDEVKITSATASGNKRGKLEKPDDILHFTTEGILHGPSAVTVDTGEVTAAAKSVLSRALTLLDVIAGCQEGAATESSGGPNPKQVRIQFDDRDENALVEEWGENP